MNGDKKIVLITGRYWEGAFVLKEFIKEGVPCKHVFIQKSWWRKENNYEYSKLYLKKLKKDKNSKTERIFYTIEELGRPKGIEIKKIENINSEDSIKKLDKINPTLIAVVGSKIIKSRVLNKFKNKFINFHTGILPEFRGPYSEFWAIYKNQANMIGTTVHLIDEGVDTGRILKQMRVDIDSQKNPQIAHFLNAKAGANLIAKTINEYLLGEITPFRQVESDAHYYTYPTNKQVVALEKRLGIKINLYFAD